MLRTLRLFLRTVAGGFLVGLLLAPFVWYMLTISVRPPPPDKALTFVEFAMYLSCGTAATAVLLVGFFSATGEFRETDDAIDED